ncbi:MAG: S24/S26 family peptidase, partial [Candidatus Acidiferrales bacterium]
MREPKTPGRSNSQQFALVCAATLQRGLTMRFQACGQSMQPNVRHGDLVEVAPISAGEPERGDIVLARNHAGFRLHRVVGRDAETGKIVTRGDAGQQNDDAPEIVLGKVISIERKQRRISLETPGTKTWHAVRAQTRRALLAVAHRA